MPRSRSPFRPHEHDVLFSVGGLLCGLLLYALDLRNSPAAYGLPGWLSLVALFVMSGAELLRRTAPQLGLTIATCALALDILGGTLVTTVLMFTDLVYAAVLYGSPQAARRIPRDCYLITALITVGTLVGFRDSAALLLGFATAMITIVPAWTGAIIRTHREAAQAARLEAERTALLAELDRREAVAAERARMARELHDMVAGHLSAIAIHSTAALSLGDPKATHEALGVIRENSVQGLAEMRRLIGLLRDASGDAEPTAVPTLDGLSTLLARAERIGADNDLSFALHDERGADPARPDPTRSEQAGPDPARAADPDAARPTTADLSPAAGPLPAADLPAPTAERTGSSAAPGLAPNAGADAAPAAGADARALPAPVELAAYRIVQEAVTNALKHAGPGQVRVRLSRAERGALRVEVVSPLGDRGGPRAPGSGTGLVGMRERATLLGGEFEAGPESAGRDRIWRVRAVLPVDEETRP
ncbi:histidine kinase [Streptomyces sp. 71268]|uniref:sensor histidine kinase n=1 Tax=Streptomyces sp. 71268 TaxID=3002640 RepID=UPI0023F992EC|nr:sensor histidine kinase [Streptomyces sp. 71268]WEV25300.1 histidine kinase [Streptomyces sp. 71268]